jgi:nicotinate phosphoribosyltransferase
VKSKPLNIVIKISSVNGNPAIKLSDDPGKHAGDKETIEEVKKELHYVEREGWNADEANRWGGN